MKRMISYVVIFTLVVSLFTMNISANNGKGKGNSKEDVKITKVDNKKEEQPEDEQVNQEDVKEEEVTDESIETEKVDKNNKKQNKKEYITAKKQELKEQYTYEELEDIDESVKKIKDKYKDAKVLEVDSVVIGNGKIKFDTPPVIKEGRTLVPVRAIVNGFGADVDWNAETKEVTIVKDDITIIMELDNDVVYVNGEEVILDAKTEVMNSRTYVPLRFIAETLGLKVSWDDESETIEIDEDEEIDEEVEEGTEEETDEEVEEGTEEETAEEVEAGTEEETDEEVEEGTEEGTEEDTEEGTAEEGTTEEGTTEEGTTEEGTTEEGTTEEGTVEEGTTEEGTTEEGTTEEGTTEEGTTEEGTTEEGTDNTSDETSEGQPQ